ncbi:YfmQ family protein [Neobacillus sp. NRS-1170]|uniref:YfmQ family protein n=1 Tax=Neobacillus sp. NRS-1170 TaxID=3233898 RepID=UPI003D2E0FB7
MTWTVLSIILISMVKIAMTCLPTGPVNWLIRKFEIHSKLSEENVTITIDGKRLEGADKIQIINDFNEATFIKQQYIYPGTEEFYLYPENHRTPIVIETKYGKKDMTIYLYHNKDQVDVVKQYKKKVIAYSLFSDRLQNVVG